MALYMKIVDAIDYLEEYSVFEKSENQKILDFIEHWLERLKEDITKEILSEYYHYPESMGECDIREISHILNEKNKAFKIIANENMKYVPIQSISPAIKTMVEEILSLLPDEIKVGNVYYKTISKYNFTESKMRSPGYNFNAINEVETKIGGRPNVLSMTIIYHDNPLMWPLIFHEYGHTVFKRIKSKSKYQKIHSKLRVHCGDAKIDIDPSKLNTIVSEIFSDIFAINYYHLNYFLSFYFHEILSANVDELTQTADGEFQLQNHPPSAIRMKYMIKEIEKRGFGQDEVLPKILEYQKPFADELYKEIKIPAKYISLFEEIYNEISTFFEEELICSNVKIQYDLINKLYTNLQNKYPIGTFYNKEMDLNEALHSNDTFDIETNNDITNIIYAGWKFLILDMLDKFYEIRNEHDYLPNCNLKEGERSGKNVEDKILKFSKEYKFLLSNIRYSMETSMIVSHYLEGS